MHEIVVGWDACLWGIAEGILLTSTAAVVKNKLNIKYNSQNLHLLYTKAPINKISITNNLIEFIYFIYLFCLFVL